MLRDGIDVGVGAQAGLLGVGEGGEEGAQAEGGGEGADEEGGAEFDCGGCGVEGGAVGVESRHCWWFVVWVSGSASLGGGGGKK